MRKLLLHIGLPKTGTTLLQRDIFPLANKKDGCRFTGKTCPGKWDGRGLWRNVHLYSALEHDDLAEVARREIAGTKEDYIIFSSEAFLNPFGFKRSSLQPTITPVFERLDRFFSLLPTAVEVTILVTIRHQAKWLESFHIECLKQGFVTNFSEQGFWQLLAERIEWAPAVLTYQKLARELHIRYNPSRIHIIPCEEIVESPKAAFEAIFDLFGCAGLDLPLRAPVVNVRRRARGRILLSGQDRKFMTRRILAQVVDSRLSWRDRSVRVAALLSPRRWQLATKGLKGYSESFGEGIMEQLYESNRLLSPGYVALNDLERFNYVRSPA